MKHYIFAAFASLTLAACATSSDGYGPSQSASDFGFQNRQLEQDRFRVSYTGESVGEARDYVLLRSAEIAINEGYSHFKIINSGTSGNGPSPNIATGVGVGFGSFGRRNVSNVNLGVGVNDVARALEGTKVTETIEIKLQQTSATDPAVYDAQSVFNSIRPLKLQNTVAP